MAKKAKDPTGVTDAVIITEEITIDNHIKQEVAKYNLADASIAKMKKKYAGLKVKDVTDKEGIKVLKEALSEVSGTRTGIEKKRKEIKDEYLTIGRAIDGEAKRLTELILEVEQPLREEKERIDAELAAEKTRKEEEAAQALRERVEALKEAGMTFDGDFYSIGGTISMDISTIKQMKDSDFEFLKAKVEMEAIRIQKEAAEEARRKEEEEAKAEAERKKLAEEQAELKRQQDAMDAERKAFEKEKQDLADAKLKAEQEAAHHKDRMLAEKISQRAIELNNIGFFYSNSRGVYLFSNKAGELEVHPSHLQDAADLYWAADVLGEMRNKAARLVKIEEEIISKEKEEARLKVIEEQKKEAEAKQKQEAEEKAEADRLEAERLAALPDVEKLENYFTAIMSAEEPEIANEDLRDLLQKTNHTIATAISAAVTVLKQFNK